MKSAAEVRAASLCGRSSRRQPLCPASGIAADHHARLRARKSGKPCARRSCVSRLPRRNFQKTSGQCVERQPRIGRLLALFAEIAKGAAPSRIQARLQERTVRARGRAFDEYRRSRAVCATRHFVLLERIGQMRHGLTAYDAAYLALAEALDAPLITRDRALARAGSHARVEVV